MAIQLELRKTYKFDTIAPEILSGTYSSMTVVSIMNAEEAVKKQEIHRDNTAIRNIVNGLPADINDYTFILFANQYGEKSILALEYINQNSIELVTNVDINVRIRNVTTGDLGNISARLKELGYVDFDISLS